MRQAGGGWKTWMAGAAALLAGAVPAAMAPGPAAAETVQAESRRTDGGQTWQGEHRRRDDRGGGDHRWDRRADGPRHWRHDDGRRWDGGPGHWHRPPPRWWGPGWGPGPRAWVPGHWVWGGYGWVWRPGHWR
jgi:hypothetical protein